MCAYFATICELVGVYTNLLDLVPKSRKKRMRMRMNETSVKLDNGKGCKRKNNEQKASKSKEQPHW